MARFKPDTRLDRLFNKWDTCLGRRLDRHIHWGLLRRAGSSRLVTSSWLWLFVVPAAAKLLAPFAGEHDLTIPWLPDEHNVIHLDIGLPFSWKLFYVASWAFALGQAIYWCFCPEIVQRYGTYGEYHAQKGSSTLALWGAIWYDVSKRTLTEVERTALLHLLPPKYREGCSGDVSLLAWTERFGAGLESGATGPAKAFDVLLWIEERAVFWAFCVSGLAFLLGLGLFLWVLGQNAVAVCRLL